MDQELVKAFSLEGKVAVVTGAASGIGQEAARVFARAGANLVLADVDEKGLAATAAKVRAAGREAHIRRTNVAKRDEVEALADEVIQKYARLDCWINSAGITLWAGVIEAAPDAVERVISVNLMGTYWSCAAAGRVMKQLGRGGTIVNVSSTAGESPVPTLSVYGMTKAGVNQLTRVSAKEFGPFGVRVNAVVPGWIDTPINASTYVDPSGDVNEDKRAKILQQMAALSPLGIVGQPFDIGVALLYLASDASRFVTGQTLRVSGGV